MISYEPLWKTMESKKATTYTLQTKGVSSSTIRRMKANESVSTNTLDALCKILDCGLADIAEFVHDEEKGFDSDGA
jgi:DNA-binding Xre family transcriptional regulator